VEPTPTLALCFLLALPAQVSVIQARHASGGGWARLNRRAVGAAHLTGG